MLPIEEVVPRNNDRETDERPGWQHHAAESDEPLLTGEVNEEHNRRQEDSDGSLGEYAETRSDVHRVEIHPALRRPDFGQREKQQDEPRPHRDVDIDNDSAREQQQAGGRREHESRQQPRARTAEQPAQRKADRDDDDAGIRDQRAVEAEERFAGRIAGHAGVDDAVLATLTCDSLVKQGRIGLVGAKPGTRGQAVAKRHNDRR